MTQAELNEYIAGRPAIVGQRKLTREEIDRALDSLRRRTGLTKEPSMTTPRTTYRRFLDCQNEEVVERIKVASNECGADPLPAELRELIIRRNPPLNDDVAFLLGQLVELREQLAEQRSRLAAAIARAAAPPTAKHSDSAGHDWIAALGKPYFPPV